MKFHPENFDKNLISLIGCGNMGGSLIRGFFSKLGLSSDNVIVCDKDADKMGALVKEFGVRGTADCSKAVAGADIIIIALKPKLVPVVLQTIRALIEAEDRLPLVISVAGGVLLQELKEAIGPKARVVRVMPNLPCMVGVGMSAILGESTEDLATTDHLFKSVGMTTTVFSESDMDAATALGSSAPAFVFQFVEALADGGVKLGLSRDQSLTMAIQMVMGSAAMLKETGLHPAQLKDMVASPAGTTISGLHVLESASFRGAVISAIEAAGLKAAERRDTRSKN